MDAPLILSLLTLAICALLTQFIRRNTSSLRRQRRSYPAWSEPRMAITTKASINIFCLALVLGVMLAMAVSLLYQGTFPGDQLFYLALAIGAGVIYGIASLAFFFYTLIEKENRTSLTPAPTQG